MRGGGGGSLVATVQACTAQPAIAWTQHRLWFSCHQLGHFKRDWPYQKRAPRYQSPDPDIRHFILHDRARFESERSQWELEETKQQTRIASFNGERRDQEKLKDTLAERLQTLEWTLKQKEVVHWKLKDNTNLVRWDANLPTWDGGDEGQIHSDAAILTITDVPLNELGCLLRQSLHENGFAGTGMESQSDRIGSMLISDGVKQGNHRNTPARIS